MVFKPKVRGPIGRPKKDTVVQEPVQVQQVQQKPQPVTFEDDTEYEEDDSEQDSDEPSMSEEEYSKYIKKNVQKPVKQEPIHKEVQKSSSKVWSTQQVAVETETVLYNSNTQETIQLYEAVARILNILEQGSD